MTDSTVSILGYGSLLSRGSAERTFGRLPPPRVVDVPGYARVFNKVCVHSIKSGAAAPDQLEIGCACAVPLPGQKLTAALLRVPSDRAASFFAREREFRIIEASYLDVTTLKRGKALLSTMWTEQGLRDSFESDEVFDREIGQYCGGKMWRPDILPARAYLRCCLDGAEGLQIRDAFVNESLLADRSSLSEYLERRAASPEPDGKTPARYTTPE